MKGGCASLGNFFESLLTDQEPDMASMEKFTQRARHVLSLAHQEAERTHQGLIGTDHLLLGLLEEDGGVAGRVLRELGLEIDRVREIIQRVSGEGQYTGGKPE